MVEQFSFQAATCVGVAALILVGLNVCLIRAVLLQRAENEDKSLDDAV